MGVCAPNLGNFDPRAQARIVDVCLDRSEGGARVELCLIEVMKLFTSVTSGVGGTVQKILAEDFQLVESHGRRS